MSSYWGQVPFATIMWLQRGTYDVKRREWGVI